MSKFGNLPLSLGFILVTFASCGGGGGGSDTTGGSDFTEGRSFQVEALVSSETCGERISNVNQPFSVIDEGTSVLVDTSLVKIRGPKVGEGFSAEFSESNGDCVRNYRIEFAELSGIETPVILTTEATCGDVTCGSQWQGVANEALPTVENSFEKINGF